jgi:hypothetical protein
MNKIYLLLVIFSGYFQALAQNDLCSNAIVITPNSECNVVTGTFNGATISSAAPDCATSASQDVWYSFVATDKMMGITLFGTSGVSNGFEVYETNCSGTMIICRNANNATGSSESILFNKFLIGSTYMIRVFNAFSATTVNSFSICVQSYPAPVNDNCANSITLTPNLSCVSTSVNLSGSTLDGQAVTSCSPNPSQDIWYNFVATDEVMSVSLSTNSLISNGFEIYKNSCAGTMVVCRNVNGNGSGEFLSWSGFIIGETYYIRVLNEYINPVTVTFNICLQNYPAPVNDNCANSITLTPNLSCVSTPVNLSGSTLDGQAVTSCSPNPSQDVWYNFVATDEVMSVSLSTNSLISNGFEIYKNSCAGTMVVCRNVNGNGSGEFLSWSGFIIGETYYIRVLNEYINPATVTFNICLQNYPAPSNDACQNAISIPVNSTCTTNTVAMSGATLDGVSFTSCSPNPSQDVWYKFIATNTSQTVTISLTSDISNGFQVYQNGCNGSIIVCRNSNGNGQGETFTYNGYVVGTEYYIRVLNEYITPLTTSTFNVCVVDATLANEIFTKTPILIAPNPFNERINIESEIEIDRIEIYGLSGEKLIEQKNSKTINTSNLSSGFYLLKVITTTGNSFVQKVIKN